MGVYTFTVYDESSSVAPQRLFKGLCLDNHNLIPKVAPQSVKSIDFVEGDSTVVGCVKQFNFGEASPYTYGKFTINELDTDRCYVKYTAFEGDFLGTTVESVVYEAKIEPSGSGSHSTLVGHFHTKGDVVLTEEGIKGALQGMVMTYKLADEYLSNNPDVYA